MNATGVFSGAGILALEDGRERVGDVPFCAEDEPWWTHREEDAESLHDGGRVCRGELCELFENVVVIVDGVSGCEDVLELCEGPVRGEFTAREPPPEGREFGGVALGAPFIPQRNEAAAEFLGDGAPVGVQASAGVRHGVCSYMA